MEIGKLNMNIHFSLAPLQVNFWATVTSNSVRPMLRTVVLSVLSVTLVYCGQTIGWIKMPLGMEGLGPEDTVLDRHPAPPQAERGTAVPPLFGACLLWPNGRPSHTATAELLL